MAAVKSKSEKGRTALGRYALVTLALSLAFISILYGIVKIMYFEGDLWREIGKKETVKTDRTILPRRGNIYASDGRVLATSQPLYGVYMDFHANGLVDTILLDSIDLISRALAKQFPDRSVQAYKRILESNLKISIEEKKELEKARKEKSKAKIKLKTRYVRIIRKDVNYLELKAIQKMPFLRQRSTKSGLIAEEKAMRMKPFGALAGRTVGSIYKDIERGGSSGLELKYDSILSGVKGRKNRQRIGGQWIDVVETPAQDGWDIKTTLDVDIQDITEKSLYARLKELDAESGCAIVMETATGEVKAISNLDRMAEGVYAERNPNAFSYMAEPGSTFKIASIMVALEDGIVTPSDSFFVGSGVFRYKGKDVRDYDWRKGKDHGYQTVSQGIQHSSNVVVSKVILKGYENNPTRYVQHLHDLGITRRIEWDVPLHGKEGRSIIRFPSDKSNPWSKTTLAWMSFGYETQIPPMYILMFYNGIANGGKMIKPFFTKEFLKDGKVMKEFQTEVINPSLCSERTLSEIKTMLLKVVTDGTGKSVASPYFSIAGKTGTAMIASKGGYEGYYVSFCGYFPAESPKYTIFVGIRKPHGSPSGGLMSGVVFKNIAEELYARNMRMPIDSGRNDSVGIKLLPLVKNGWFTDIRKVLSTLNIGFSQAMGGGSWVQSNTSERNIEIRSMATPKGTIPDVKGMGARDAVYLLENLGVKVKLNGRGKVTNQSLTPGSRAIRGSYVSLQLE
ncbi:MAG: Cell division protein FtsI [Bacteroidetes bacterium]|nr:Cell division protein FtsI [Bacteroidota bacterium]